MNTTYKAHKTIRAAIEEVANFFAQDDMIKNYFPEVHKDTSGMSEYVCQTHKHVDQIFPDYYIPNQGFGWAAANNTLIKVPRKDINANIQGIEVDYKAVGNNTEIVIKVEFNPTIDLAGLLAVYHVHMMVTNKLTAIKRDVEANQYHGFTFSFA